MNIIELRKKDNVLFDTSILTLVFIILYTIKGFVEGFNISIILYIVINLVYFPIVLIWKRKFFCLYHIAYAYILIATIALKKTFLYNNFTAYFIILSICIIKPKWRYPALGIYFSLATIAFSIHDSPLIAFLIHISRAMYYYTIFHYFIFTRFSEKKEVLLNLKNDEFEILKQMAAGKKQKEIEGFSINTVTKKLVQAKTRNNIDTTQELLIKFIKEMEIVNDSHINSQ